MYVSDYSKDRQRKINTHIEHISKEFEELMKTYCDALAKDEEELTLRTLEYALKVVKSVVVK